MQYLFIEQFSIRVKYNVNMFSQFIFENVGNIFLRKFVLMSKYMISPANIIIISIYDLNNQMCTICDIYIPFYE